MRAFSLLVVAGVLTAGTASSQPGRSATAEAKLQKYLHGRVPGEPVDCLAVRKTNDPIGIDDDTVLFRDGPRIWRNDVREANQCGKLDKQSVIFSDSRAGRLCSGDKLAFSNGFVTGACVLGDFVPYTRP